MWAGCYMLDLYCDNAAGGAGAYAIQKDGDRYDDHGHYIGEFPRRLTGENGAVLRRKAREQGWIIGSDGSAICPKCSGKVHPTTTPGESHV